VGAWGHHAPNVCNCKKVGKKVRHAARGLVTVFSVTFFLLTVAGQIIKIPLTESVLAHLGKGGNVIITTKGTHSVIKWKFVIILDFMTL